MEDATGEVIGWKNWGDSMEKEHGAPYYVIHVCETNFSNTNSGANDILTREATCIAYCWSTPNHTCGYD